LKKLLFGLILAVTVSMGATPAFAATKIDLSGYFVPGDGVPDSTVLVDNNGITLEVIAVTQEFPCLGDMASSSCILDAVVRQLTHNNGKILFNYTASINMEFEGTIAGRTGEARFVGIWMLQSPDGNIGFMRGQLEIVGISGELEGASGRLNLSSDTIEDNLVHYEGYISFTE
jgi:hypothetical protein